jgi:hypothetical protein
MSTNPDMEIVRVKVCNECGARYHTGSNVASLHTRATGHNSWKNVKEVRKKQPSKISYQPGHTGPESY